MFTHRRRRSGAARGARAGSPPSRSSGSTSAASTAPTRGSARSTSARSSGASRRSGPAQSSWRWRSPSSSARSGCRSSSTASWRARRSAASGPTSAVAATVELARRMLGRRARARLRAAAGRTRPPAASSSPPGRRWRPSTSSSRRDADLDAGRAIAAGLRESGGGLAGVRALAIELGPGRIQISTNVHDPVAVPLAEVVELTRRLCESRGTRPVAAELVGLVPAAALAGWPEELPIVGGDPAGGRSSRASLRRRAPRIVAHAGQRQATPSQASRHPDRKHQPTPEPPAPRIARRRWRRRAPAARAAARAAASSASTAATCRRPGAAPASAACSSRRCSCRCRCCSASRSAARSR